MKANEINERYAKAFNETSVVAEYIGRVFDPKKKDDMVRLFAKTLGIDSDTIDANDKEISAEISFDDKKEAVDLFNKLKKSAKGKIKVLMKV